MNLTAKSFVTFILLFIVKLALAQPTNDECANATSLNSYTGTCTSATAGTLTDATNSGVAANGTCGGNPDDDVWYKFVAQNTSGTITLSGIQNGNGNLGNATPTLELFSGACGTGLVSLKCKTGTSASISYSGLVIGSAYYVRVYSGDAGFPNKDATFKICVTHTPLPVPPSNDDCSAAVTLSNGVTNSSGTVWNATASSSIPVGCAAGDPDDDVWYKFTTAATSNSLTISLPAIGTDLNSSGAKIQVFTGSCGALTSFACGTNPLTVAATGNTAYYIRIYSAGTGALGSNSSGSTFSINATESGPVTVTSGRMNEVFQQTILSGSGQLQYPWEVTYGPDNYLWVTESRGYKVYRMDPNTGAKTTALDISQNSTFLPSPYDTLNVQFSGSQNPWPQGGLAGLALHPNFMDGTGLHDYVFVSYVHRFLTGGSPGGYYFRNKLVRFTYNSGTGKLESPVVVCDTLPGGSDHNSQRIIIAPVTKGGTYYIFYAQGDMGAGQFANRLRPENAQYPTSYEGKILRFNTEPDGDSGGDAWIPNDNPYNTLLGKQSAVYSIGIRNNQGFAYDSTTNMLYGSSHGPYSDDEINVIEGFRNYGHPLIQGFVDGNYNGNSVQGTNTSISAGAPWPDNSGVSTCQPIGDEAANKAAIDASGNGLYKDPMFSAYAASQAEVTYIWQNNPGNALPAPGWPTEAWSGLDLYSNKLIPGWKRSLVAASLKWGRLVKLKLNASGDGTAPTNTDSDTVSYFGSRNRFRDLAFSPDGKDIFVIMDNNSTTSGPGAANPVVPACAGCVQKYTFLGYNSDANGKSMIPSSIDVAAGTPDGCQAGTTITIDNNNTNLWVPITGEDGNILAEIKANGNILGTVTSSFYTNSGSVRENGSKKLYSDRNITITPQTQPSSAVSVRVYITAAEYDALKTATNSQGESSGVNSVTDLTILKNSDACGSAMTNATTSITPAFAESFGSNYVVQGDVTSFSTFYIGGPASVTLPVQLLTFTGKMQENNSVLLKWETASEINTSHFTVERSTDGNQYNEIGSVAAKGSENSRASYNFTDYSASVQSAGTLFYRLKTVDKNGRFAFSRVVSFTLDKQFSVSVYPNPVKQVLNVKLSKADPNPVLLQISDLNGRIIYSERRSGTNTNISVDVKQWKPQVYVLKVINSRSEVLTTQKFEKM